MKDNLSPLTKFAFFFSGTMLIATYNVTVSSAPVWINFFGGTNYTIINFALSIPNIIIALIIPKLIKVFGLQKLGYGNMIAQIISGVLFTSSVYIAMYPFSERVESRYIASMTVIYVTILLSSSFFAISQTVYYGLAAQFSQMTVEFYITGMSFCNLLFGLFFLALNTLSLDPKIDLLCRYSFSILLNVIGIFIYVYINKNIPEKSKIDEGGKSEGEGQQRNLIEIYKLVIMKKKFLLTLNSLLFFFVFLAYPTFMFSMTPSNPKLANYWGTILMLIFGASECSARVINTMNFKILRSIFKQKTIWIHCIIAYIGCIVPVMMYLASKGVFYVDPLAMDIVNCLFYGFLAFCLGILGNNIAIFLYDGLSSQTEVNVIGTLFSLTIVTSISAGIGTSLGIAQAFK